MNEKARPGARRRPAIGRDPLDALIPAAPPAPTDTAPRAAGEEREWPGPPAEPRGKVRATFHLPAALLDEARDAVVALSGPPVRLTLAELAETALRRELDRLKATYNGGEDFPPRAADLRGGRPIGS